MFLRMGLIGPAGNSRGEQHKHAIGRGGHKKGGKTTRLVRLGGLFGRRVF